MGLSSPETRPIAQGAGPPVARPAEVAAIIARAGFTPPVRCDQAGRIHGWVARRA